MSNIKDLFGESTSESEGEGKGVLTIAKKNKDENEEEEAGKATGDWTNNVDIATFEKEWEKWEEAQEQRELEERAKYEVEQAERKRKLQEAEQWKRTVASQYQKHPPREIGLEKREHDSPHFYYHFQTIYPDLFQVAYSRVANIASNSSNHRLRVQKLQESRKMSKLPCSALEYYFDDNIGGSHLRFAWTPQLRAFLEGVRETTPDRINSSSRKRVHDSDKTKQSDDLAAAATTSPLAILRNYECSIVRLIFSFLSHYGHHVTMTIPAEVVWNATTTWGGRRNRFNLGGARGAPKVWNNLTSDNYSYSNGSGYVAFSKVGQVLDLFPPPNGRNVNMMPFVLGNQESLPTDLQCFYPLIDACPFVKDEFGKVAFLTVHETETVEKYKTQRRSGLHIESPGVFADHSSSSSRSSRKMKNHHTCSFTPGEEIHHWGCGTFSGPDRYHGGIYLASNVDDSTKLWDALVDSSIPGIVNRHGGLDHLKSFFPDSISTRLKAGELVWMTDCTPHEAVPQTQECQRTFFRLVMPYVTHWYAAHSTPNPKVSIPDSTTVIEDSKFAAFEQH